jgi:hypothetical protein
VGGRMHRPAACRKPACSFHVDAGI